MESGEQMSGDKETEVTQLIGEVPGQSYINKKITSLGRSIYII